jgi:hypothetical protein
MNRIIRENYPASRLPDDLRVGVDLGARVTVTITLEEQRSKRAPTLDEIWAMRRPPFRTKEQIDAELRQQRDEWND